MKYSVKHIKEVAKRLTEYEKGLKDPDYRWDRCQVCESAHLNCNKCLINDCCNINGTILSDRPWFYGTVRDYDKKLVRERYEAMLKRANDNLKKSDSDWIIEGAKWKKKN